LPACILTDYTGGNRLRQQKAQGVCRSKTLAAPINKRTGFDTAFLSKPFQQAADRAASGFRQ
jgi:hypothetical protein